jgi:DNA-binding transcriptional ArsR family regulator
MVYYPTIPLDRTFTALAHPIRRGIVNQLSKGAASVKELAAPFSISLQGFLKHIVILEESGLVVTQKRGRVRYCELNASPMQSAAEFLAFYEPFWQGQLDALANYLEENDDPAN